MPRKKISPQERVRASYVMYTDLAMMMISLGLPAEDRLAIYEWMSCYRYTLGDTPDPHLTDRAALAIFLQLKMRAINDLEEYLERCKEDVENGAKGGKQKEKNRQNKAKETAETEDEQAETDADAKAAGMSDEELVACYQRHCESLGIQPHEEFLEKYLAKGWPRTEASVKKWAENDAKYDKERALRGKANRDNCGPRTINNFASETDVDDQYWQVMEAQEAAKTQLPSAG